MFSLTSEMNANIKTKVVKNVCVATIDVPGQKVFSFLNLHSFYFGKNFLQYSLTLLFLGQLIE